MGILFIVSGLSGVGKNSVVDGIEGRRYFHKVGARYERPDDRPDEIKCINRGEYDILMSKKRIALPYEVRGNSYGLLIDSFSELKNYDLFVCLSDFDLIESLTDAVDTTNIYIGVDDVEKVIQRLNQREDHTDQRRKSIESIPRYLEEYEKRKHLFEHTIDNSGELSKAQEELKSIFNLETDDNHTVDIEFMCPKKGHSMGALYGEIDHQNKGMGYVDQYHTILPDVNDVADDLDKMFNTLYSGSPFNPKRIFSFDGVVIDNYSREDKESIHASVGHIVLHGRKRNVDGVKKMILEKWPQLEKNHENGDTQKVCNLEE